MSPPPGRLQILIRAYTVRCIALNILVDVALIVERYLAASRNTDWFRNSRRT